MIDLFSKYCDCNSCRDLAKLLRVHGARPDSRALHRLIHQVLDELVAEGKLVRRFKDGSWRYFARELGNE